MALDVKGFLAVGFAIAKSLFPDAFDEAIVRFSPTTQVDPVKDKETILWEFEEGISIFGYDDSDERKTQDPGVTVRSFLLDWNDVPTDAKVDEAAEIEIDGLVWEVYRVETVPGKSLSILYART